MYGENQENLYKKCTKKQKENFTKQTQKSKHRKEKQDAGTKYKEERKKEYEEVQTKCEDKTHQKVCATPVKTSLVFCSRTAWDKIRQDQITANDPNT